MNDERFVAGVGRARRVQLLVGLLLPVLSVLALGATVETSQFPGRTGTVVERSGDGLVPSFRYRGTQRFDTARLIGEDTFAAPDQVLIARGDLFPDSLSGSFVAGNLDAPLLLTESRRLTPDTRASLNRLGPSEVLLLGGTEAIHQATEDQIRALGYPTERIAGPDRFDTAREAATYAGTSVGTRSGDEFSGRTAIVARADRFADALVAGSVSYASNYPLLLTTANTLHQDAEAALQSLGIETVIIPGGTSAVSANVENEIESMGITVDRVSGVDRVETSVNFAFFLRDELNYDIEHVNMARGERFADALTIGPHAGEEFNPIVLTANNTTLGGAGSVAEMLELVCGVGNIHVAGGFAAISADLEQSMRQMAVDTGAICDISFEEGDGPDEVVVNPLGTETRTVEGTVVDNAGNASHNTADVRWQVFRGDFQQENGTVELLAESTTTTNASSQFTFQYPESSEPAWDYVVACTTASSNNAGGDDPGTCLTGGDTQLEVVNRMPRNVDVDLASNFQIKQWGEEDVGPQDLSIEFERDFAANQVGTEHTFTAVVTDGAGDPVEDADVRFDVFRDGDPAAAEAQFGYQPGRTLTTTTNSAGQAQLTYTGPSSVADDRVTACITDDDTTGDPVCGEVVDATGDPTDDDDSETVEATNALPSDLTRKLWGFLASSLSAEATGIQGELLGDPLLDQPTSRVELPGPNDEQQGEDTGGLEIGVLDDLVRAGVTTTRAAGQLGTVPAASLLDDVGDPHVATATARATTADVEVLGILDGPSLLGLLDGVDPDLLEDVNLDLLDSLLGGDGSGDGLLDDLTGLDTGLLSDTAMVQQLDGDGHLLAAELIDVATTTDCRTGPYGALDEASDSRFVNAEVLGQEIPVEPEPNTGIRLEGLVEVIINEVEPTGMADGDGEFGYEVRGLRVHLLDSLLSGGLEVVISEAITEIDCIGQTFADPDYDTSEASLLADGTEIPGGVDWQTVDVDPRPFLDKLEAMTDRQLFTDEQRAEIDRKYEAYVQRQQ